MVSNALLDELRAAHGADAFDEASSAGRALSLPKAIRLAAATLARASETAALVSPDDVESTQLAERPVAGHE